MKIDIITLFPEMLRGFLETSMMKKAVESNYVQFNIINPRDFTEDKHRTTDDRPFGGGPGMIMKPEPLVMAIESVKTDISRVILLSPSGTTFNQSSAERLVSKSKHLILICGHYEGIDERVIELLVDEQISIGDYILTNGALASAVISDSIVRLIPGVLGGGEDAIKDESYTKGLLDFPQYTRPVEFRDLKVPDILLSGDHALIEEWRYKQSLERTFKYRPDLIKLNNQKDENNT